MMAAVHAGAYLAGVGCLVGVAVERVRYDRARAEVIGRYARALETTRAALMQLEREAAPVAPALARSSETPARPRR
jgi:hypothetical protein